MLQSVYTAYLAYIKIKYEHCLILLVGKMIHMQIIS